MYEHGMISPVVALVIWSMIMLIWLYATRIPAMRAAKVPMDPNLTAADLNAAVQPHVRWKADNYNRLMEQPTIFYAIALTLAVAGQGDGPNAWIAWSYVGLRVVHSLVQATVNAIMVRWAVFMASSLLLVALTLRATMALF